MLLIMTFMVMAACKDVGRPEPTAPEVCQVKCSGCAGFGCDSGVKKVESALVPPPDDPAMRAPFEGRSGARVTLQLEGDSGAITTAQLNADLEPYLRILRAGVRSDDSDDLQALDHALKKPVSRTYDAAHSGGAFLFEGVLPGDYTIHAHGLFAYALVGQAGVRDDDLLVTGRVQEGGAVAGRLVDSDGGSCADFQVCVAVEVPVWPTKAHLSASNLRCTRTGADGSFVIEGVGEREAIELFILRPSGPVLSHSDERGVYSGRLTNVGDVRIGLSLPVHSPVEVR